MTTGALEFSARILVSSKPKTIVLSGNLDATEDVRQELEAVLAEAAKEGGNWRIDAHNTTVVPEGVELYRTCVERLLNECSLQYGPSQLATIVQFDPAFDISRSAFEEDHLPE